MLVFSRDGSIMVFVNRWSLLTGSYMQKSSHWEIKNVVAIDRESPVLIRTSAQVRLYIMIGL